MFHIRFAKFNVCLEMVEDCKLPQYKVSAIRGGLGQMLLQQNCIMYSNHNECSNCSFVNSCIVQNIMYAPYKIQPEFQVSHESMGYIIDCPDLTTEYETGELLKVTITLFGDTISQFMPLVYALTSLGMNGLGKEQAHFQIASIDNRYHQPILRGGVIDLSNVLVEYIEDYIHERIGKSEFEGRVNFITPCSIKHAGVTQENFEPEAVIASLNRRLYMYNMFEGNQMDKPRYNRERLPRLIASHAADKRVPRYSNTSGRKMVLSGIQGSMTIEDCDEETLKLLYAGEIIHVGKNVHFGFGNMRVR